MEREAREREAAAAREREAAAARAQEQQAEAARREAEARAAALEHEKLQVVREQTAAAELAAEMKKLETGYPGTQGRQTPRGWVLAFNSDLLFERGTTLRGAAGAALNDIADFLHKYPDRLVAIESFTDGQGGKESAERLSERRAEAVKFALVQRGVEPYRIHARGYAGASAGASNDTEDGRQPNRRVEIVISPS
jgi:outer membrane protein OmpA-like peptidoglycan-associated protein